MKQAVNSLAAKGLFCVAVAVLMQGCGDKPPPAAAPEPAKSITQSAPADAKKAEAPKPDADALLAAKVKAVLSGDAELKSLAIDVTVKDGVVSLHGTASTKSRRDKAGKLVGKLEGVKSVDNGLVILAGS